MNNKEYSDKNLEEIASTIEVPKYLYEDDKNHLVEFEYWDEIEILETYSSDEEEPSIDLDL